MKKVMLITQSIKGGGAEKVAANLSIALSEFCDVYIVSYRKDDDEFIHAGKRINLNMPGGEGTVFQKIQNAIHRTNAIKRLKLKYNIDFAISFVPQTDYANVLSKVKGCKNLIEISSNSLAAFASKKSKLLRELILKSADTVITVTEGSREQVIEAFHLESERVKCIYNPIDIKEIQKKAKSVEDENNSIPEKYIVAIGSFRKPKGHWHLIKAFAVLLKDFPDYSLVILGDGDYKDKYVELAKRLSIPKEKLYLPGYLSNPYIILSKSSLMIFSSIYEGFGNVIVEALSCGVPVISTDCDFGPREILAPQTELSEKTQGIEYATYGCLIKPFTMEDISLSASITEEEQNLAKAMKELLLNQEMCDKYRHIGIKRCMDFDLKTTVSKWLDLMEL